MQPPIKPHLLTKTKASALTFLKAVLGMAGLRTPLAVSCSFVRFVRNVAHLEAPWISFSCRWSGNCMMDREFYYTEEVVNKGR